MEPVRERVRSVEINAGKERYILMLDSEDFSALYPGMIRYTLTAKEGERIISVFRTNSFEYSPLVALAAQAVAEQTADAWEREIRNNPLDFILSHRQQELTRRKAPKSDLVILQGSPRALGNCSILAGWAVEAAHELGRTAQVIYPHDLDIRCCIGCYQCYNAGTCVFDDDMGSIIGAIREASLLVVCAPVYTNTVPGGLKLLIDRCQAYHAERILAGGRTGQKGLIFSVAGRKGEENFACVTQVLSVFLRNLGIRPAGEILIDRIDSIRDIRTIHGLEDSVRKKVKHCLITDKKPEK
ncbi:MAG: flavodoxin family protein [Methanoregula sp.]|jgi:multimeric flavodoxin WrbA|nr:flavodoxin family protein [Methanoregula sp.]